MSGREGLIDTAVKTSETGYIQRQMVKAMEDLKVHYDRSVRNANGVIVQTLYGDDGVDSVMVVSQDLPTLQMSCLDIHDKYSFKKDENFMNFMHPSAARESKGNSEVIHDRIKTLNEQMIDDRDKILESAGEKIKAVNYPVHFEMIIGQAINAAGIEEGDPTDLSPIVVLDNIDSLIDYTIMGQVQGNQMFKALIR